jgi:tetratricopeptide (TPR) repeat protein
MKLGGKFRMGIFKELSVSATRLKLTKEADRAWENKDYRKAIEAYSKLIKLEGLPNEQYSLYYEFRGDLYSELEDEESALNEYETAVELNPLSDRAIAKLAYQLYIVGEDEDAYFAVYKALKINPNNDLANQVLSYLDEEED